MPVPSHSPFGAQPSNPAAPAGLREGIQELAEIAVAAGDVMDWFSEALADDSKISRMELFSLPALIPVITRAVSGSGKAFAEIKDMNGAELRALVWTALEEGARKWVTKDPLGQAKLDIALELAVGNLDGVRRWQNLVNPPVAQPA